MAFLKRHFSLSILFALLLFFGIGCRFYNLLWDQGALLHPDERFVVDTTLKIKFGAPFFNSVTSPLNPANYGAHYVYGQLPLFIGKLAYFVTHRSLEENAQAQLIIGRFLSALFDSITVLLTFLIGRRLFETKWALFGAMCVSLAALHVQHSHFFVTDTFAATFITASFWAGVRFAQQRKRYDAVLMSLFWGLAMACKISAIFWGIGVLGMFVLGFLRRGEDETPADSPKKRQLSFPILFLLCLFVAGITFRIFNPMAFRGEILLGFFDIRPDMRFLGDLNQQSGITRGDADVPFNVQWIGTPKWLFSIKNLGNWGYGWAILVSGFGGVLLLAKKRRGELVVAGLFALLLFGVQGAQFSKFTRYFLPMTPFIGLLAAYFWCELSQKKSRLKFGAIGTAVWAAGWCLAVASIYTREHSRLAGSKWLISNIAPGTPIANETSWDEGMPIGWMPSGNGGFQFFNLETYDIETPEKRQKMLDILDKTEWVFFSSGRSWQNIPRWPAKYPMTNDFYSAMWDGSLGFEKVREFTSYPHIGPIEFPDDNSEEALSVYDHPRVIIWKKTDRYSHQNAESILGDAPLPTNQNWIPNQANQPLKPTKNN